MNLIRRAGKVVFAACDYLLPNPTGPRILIYHQVGSGLGRQMEVRLSDFTRQLKWLDENRSVVTLDEALGRWHDDDADNLVVLTFDDGYADTFQTAFPLLAERSMPFVLYLSTSHIESQEPLDPVARARPLEWPMIREMLDSGLVEVGAHTHNHRDLRTASPEEVHDELVKSDTLIGERLGATPRHFAYPWGYWSETAEGAVKERYDSAVLGGSPRPLPRPPRHQLHRYPVQLSDGFALFRARLRGGLLIEEGVRRRVRRYAGP
jgi:peptidoglycan/xylan/chitin deacetylase (PgdA/CDA1 family)